jgi:signal transduction histidine kinase/HPt (histidine-containing phosphotransfer) domain-containing protein
MSNNEKNRILIVDDEKLNIEILGSILGPDYTVYMTKSGSSAIELANKHLPDLILLDILMPDMDGFEVLNALKASEKTRDIPVIFITGLDSVKDEEKGLALGAADFIHKPFSNSIVQSRVRNQIQLVNQIRELVKLQEELEAAVKTAEAANSTKSAFLARMSHEIRTPLNAVVGISEIQLQNEAHPKETKEAFTRIYNSGDLLLGIINDILDLSKIEAGRLELTPARYDVASLINDTVFLNMIKYENKPIDFVLDVDEHVPAALLGDELRIKQILNNLLSNAFKYTNSGEVKLSVAAENSADAVTLIFHVRDTGQGMTPEQLEKLGDEYSRFNQEANRTTEGTGLGMSITQNLVRMMEGVIKAESEPGKGSLFTVRLRQGNVGAPPLGREVTEKLREFRSNYEAKAKKTQIVREAIPNGKVLIVDDMDMNLYVAKGMLSPYGLQIDTATSGPEAIEKVKRSEYDLVFMDHMMPKMDGMEAAQEIRKLGGVYEKLPIVALTANAVAGMKEMFLSSGFNGFISKPIVMRELDKIIREWLSPEKLSQRSEADGAAAASNAEANGGSDIDSFIDEISKIEEINTEIGLSRFPGMKDLYHTTVDMFHKKLPVECGNMTGFLDVKDMGNFSISVHSMKSLLATVGAMRLSETALELESASKKGETDFCLQKFPEFREKLLLLHTKLSVIFPGDETAQKKGPGDMNRLREDVKKALAAAENFDNDTGMEIIKNLLPYDFGVENNNLLENALNELENFEYEGAAGLLGKIR